MCLDAITSGVLPGVAVAVLIENNPVVELGLILKVPNQAVAVLDSVVVGGTCVHVKCIEGDGVEFGSSTFLHLNTLNVLLKVNLSGLLVDQLVVDTGRSTNGNSSCEQKYK